MMIMGDTCTRACAFCNVKTGLPGALDARRAGQCRPRGRKAGPEACGHHIGGPRRSGRRRRGSISPKSSAPSMRTAPARRVEVLTPDFLRKDGAHRDGDGGAARCLQPQSGNRAAALSDRAARRALFRVSLRLLERAKELVPTGFTKSGPDGGAGRKPRRDHAGDGRSARRAAWISSPSANISSRRGSMRALERFWTPEEFAGLEAIARAKGFLMVSALAADALVLSRRQRFRAAEGGPRAAQRDRAPRDAASFRISADLMYRDRGRCGDNIRNSCPGWWRCGCCRAREDGI